MINREDFEEAYQLLDSIISAIRNLTLAIRTEQYRRTTNKIQYYDNAIQNVMVSSENMRHSGSKFRVRNTISDSEYSFIRSAEHREYNVSIEFMYGVDNIVRIGEERIAEFDFSEENLFQQSLIYDADIMLDIEFLGYLKNRKLQGKFALHQDAFSIEGLRDINKTLEDELCQFLIQKSNHMQTS